MVLIMNERVKEKAKGEIASDKLEVTASRLGLRATSLAQVSSAVFRAAAPRNPNLELETLSTLIYVYVCNRFGGFSICFFI